MEQEQIIRSLKRQLLVERAVIAAVLLVLLMKWAVGWFGNAPYAVFVDDRPVVVLKDADSANKVLSAVKRAKAGTEENVQFVQDVRVGRLQGGGPVITEPKAVEDAGKKLQVRMEKWVIMSNGKPAAAVDSQDKAANVLETLKAKYGQQVKNLLEEPQFKENVKVELTEVDESLYRAKVDEAVKLILHPETPRREPSRPRGKSSVSEYTVKNGDIAANIASKLGMKLEDLEKLNRGRNLAKLQIGDKIRVSGGSSDDVSAPEPAAGKAKITVVVRDLVSERQMIPYTTTTISSTNMYQGKTFVSQPGRNGLRDVKMAVTYENGVRKGSEIIEEQVIREMAPKRIVQGIKSR